MKEKEDIIERLSEISFHDLPVNKISFITENSTNFLINFALYQEEKKDYENWIIEFLGVKELKTDNLYLKSDSDLEIYSFDYKLEELFNCKIIFLTGFGQSSFEVSLSCEKINLNKTKHRYA
jgi:hypothetical protein